jgi:hypothetical protein
MLRGIINIGILCPPASAGKSNIYTGRLGGVMPLDAVALLLLYQPNFRGTGARMGTICLVGREMSGLGGERTAEHQFGLPPGPSPR